MTRALEQPPVPLRSLRKGDRIRFRAPTRWSCRPVWRVVNGLDPHRPGRVTVRFGGWGAFVVMPHEILEIELRGRTA